MPVAGQRPLGQQLAAERRSRRLGPAGRGAEPGQGGPGRHLGVLEVVADRADDHRSLAEQLDQRLGGLAGVADAAEQHHQPVALHRAQRVHARGPGRPAYLVEETGLACARWARSPARPPPGPDRPSRPRWPATGSSRRPRRAAPRRRRAPRAGRPRHRAPRRPGRRPRRSRTRPRGRSAASRRAPPGASSGSSSSSTFASTTSIESRTRSTVCCRLITPARARGAAPKTDEATSVPSSGPDPPARNHSTKLRMPACTISPTQERSSALSSRNHGMSASIRAVAAVLRVPEERDRATAARSRADSGLSRATPRA